MVHGTKLKWGATILTVACVALLTASSFHREIVVGTEEVAVASETKSCTVGQLGVYNSNYHPECSGLPGVPFESDTTEFWPLIPAQNAYGANTAGVPAEFKALGLSGKSFSTCEEYMPESYNNVSNALALTGLGPNFQNVQALVFGLLKQQLPNCNFTSFPESLVEPLKITDPNCGPLVSLCTGKTITECLSAVGVAFKLPAAQMAALTPFIGLVATKCIPAGATTITSCAGGWWFWASLYVGFDIEDPSMSVADFQQALVSECNNSGSNQKAISNAQSLIIAGLVFLWLGFCLVVMVPFSNNAMLTFAACATVGIGSILYLVALLLVQGSPVYKNIGGDCPQNEVCYNEAISLSLGKAGIILGFIASLLLPISETNKCKSSPKDEHTKGSETVAETSMDDGEFGMQQA